jgi:DnaJ like chaperone protein
MIIWGKLIGAAVGMFVYGPVGLILGLVFGHIFDNGLKNILNTSGHSVEARTVFFRTVFQTMGYLAKANGVVSENELKVARDVMLHDFDLNTEQMNLAIQYFNEGKQTNFDIDTALKNFRLGCGSYADLPRFFLELQIKAVLADQVFRAAERDRLIHICEALNIPLSELYYQLQSYGYAEAARDDSSRTTYQSYNSADNEAYNYAKVYKQQNSLEAAYSLLGVSLNDDEKTIKSAYRRMVSKYHPDKLVAKGLPPEMMTIAKEKTQQITVAYDLIMRSRA